MDVDVSLGEREEVCECRENYVFAPRGLSFEDTVLQERCMPPGLKDRVSPQGRKSALSFRRLQEVRVSAVPYAGGTLTGSHCRRLRRPLHTVVGAQGSVEPVPDFRNPEERSCVPVRQELRSSFRAVSGSEIAGCSILLEASRLDLLPSLRKFGRVAFTVSVRAGGFHLESGRSPRLNSEVRAHLIAVGQSFLVLRQVPLLELLQDPSATLVTQAHDDSSLREYARNETPGSIPPFGRGEQGLDPRETHSDSPDVAPRILSFLAEGSLPNQLFRTRLIFSPGDSTTILGCLIIAI